MIPERSRVVVVGGGIAGCSLLYHLGRLGWTDTVLLEIDLLGEHVLPVAGDPPL